MAWTLYEISAAVIMGWALFHLLLGRGPGLIGKLLYFCTAAEAGSICLPAPWHLPYPETVLPMVAMTIIYQEIFINYRERRNK